jgi:putative heme degradation protein
MPTVTASGANTHVVTTTGLHAYIEFIKAHEKIVLAALVLGVALFLGNKYINHSADVAIAKNAAAQQVLQAQADANAKLAAATKADADRYATLLAQVTAQNQSLMAQIAARDKQVVVQQAEIKTMPLPEVAAKWVQLADIPPAEVTAVPGGLQVSEDGARKTTSMLAETVAVQADYSDLKKINTNKDSQIVQLSALNTSLNNQIGGLNLEIKDKTKACTDQVNMVKATSNRSKRNWFLRGLSAGAVIGGYLIHVL